MAASKVTVRTVAKQAKPRRLPKLKPVYAVLCITGPFTSIEGVFQTEAVAYVYCNQQAKVERGIWKVVELQVLREAPASVPF